MSGPNAVRKAVHWTAAGTLGSELLGLVFLVVLARLLTPEDYGLVAVLGAVIAISLTIVDAGLAKTLVQRPSIGPDEETTAFAMQLGLGLAMSGALFAAAPAIAWFYGDPRLELLTQVAALRPLLTSFAPVQQALLERDLDFKTQALVDLLANLAAGVVAIVLAQLGFGPWALVAQMLLWAGGRSALLWAMRPWRPRGRCTWAVAKSLLPFTWRLLASGLVHTTFDQLNTLAIGRLLSIADIGLYNRARNLQTPVTAAIGAVVHKVSFAAYARIQEDRPRLLAAYRKTMRLLAAVNAPIMLGLCAVAPTLVPAVLSDRWSAAIPLLQGFACFGLISPFAAQAQNVILAIGRADLVLRFTILRHALTVIFLLLTWRHGLTAIVAGVVARTVLVELVSVVVLRRLLAYRYRDQIADGLPPLLAGGCAAAGAVACAWAWPGIGLVQLAAQVVCGIVVWLSVLAAFRRGVFAEAWEELWRAVRRRA